MSKLGRKFSSAVGKIGRKIPHGEIRKIGKKVMSQAKSFASKAAHEVKDTYADGKKYGRKAIKVADKGLVIADRVVGKVEKGIKKVSNIASKLESVPVLGEFAGMASSGLKQLGSGVSVARKGVKGLEKATRKVEHLGHTIGSSKKKFMTGNDDNIADGVKDLVGGFKGLKR